MKHLKGIKLYKNRNKSPAEAEKSINMAQNVRSQTFYSTE
jgi:hypothetical protein